MHGEVLVCNKNSYNAMREHGPVACKGGIHAGAVFFLCMGHAVEYRRPMRNPRIMLFRGVPPGPAATGADPGAFFQRPGLSEVPSGS